MTGLVDEKLGDMISGELVNVYSIIAVTLASQFNVHGGIPKEIDKR